LLNCKIFANRNGIFCTSTSLSRIFLGAILGISVCLSVMGCAFLGRVATTDTGVSVTPETPKSLAYYHFLKAQQLLVADNPAGAIQEYETAITNDPESPFLEMELAALYQRQGDVKQALAHVEKSLRLDPKQ
jgi:tetratricopeptide (TPR) repeat protein